MSQDDPNSLGRDGVLLPRAAKGAFDGLQWAVLEDLPDSGVHRLSRPLGTLSSAWAMNVGERLTSQTMGTVYKVQGLPCSVAKRRACARTSGVSDAGFR